jgi:hypothetical protein
MASPRAGNASSVVQDAAGAFDDGVVDFSPIAASRLRTCPRGPRADVVVSADLLKWRQRGGYAAASAAIVRLGAFAGFSGDVAS